VEPLATVADLVKARDENFEQAVYRFAAQSEPNSALTPQEYRDGLNIEKS
jgi:hypothetical protein